MNNIKFWHEEWRNVVDSCKSIQTRSLDVGVKSLKKYTFDVRDNYGNENGECVYKSLEECCRSLGMLEYDINYWKLLKEETMGKDAILGIPEFAWFVRKSNILECKKIGFLSDIINAYKRNWRVIICKESHAAVVYQLRIWSDGHFEIEIAETSPTPMFCDDSKDCKTSIVKGCDKIDYDKIALFVVYPKK